MDFPVSLPIFGLLFRMIMKCKGGDFFFQHWCLLELQEDEVRGWAPVAASCLWNGWMKYVCE